MSQDSTTGCVTVKVKLMLSSKSYSKLYTLSYRLICYHSFSICRVCFPNSFILVHVGHSGSGGEVVATGCPCQQSARHGSKHGKCELSIFNIIQSFELNGKVLIADFKTFKTFSFFLSFCFICRETI